MIRAAEAKTVLPSSPVESFAPLQVSMDATLFKESIDPDWAEGARRLIADAIERTLPDGSQLENILCYSTICRLTSSHASRTRANDFVRTFLGARKARPWNCAYVTGLTEENPQTRRVTMMTYLMREGSALPRIGDDQ